eukprot:TRINITY_DN19687_c0_g1_i2.p1 TRINITY_DN19687_c0_g1~~TRINITY_DN19687_c0_g1_i2.p1  ORF type:complete len:524 (-),score=110.06 TRINITY_DN19687_c0_g1_i2:317-1888(-)
MAPTCPQNQCDSESRCIYTRHYAEDSTSAGMLVSDVVTFGDTSSVESSRILFGCETRETGDLYSQKADGIIGLGRGPLSIINQLVLEGATEDVFSLCYGGMEHEGGSMIIGKAEMPTGMEYTAFSHPSLTSYYNVVIEELSIDGTKLALDPYAFDQGYGVVLDSGTTFTYLPGPVFDAFKEAVTAGTKDLHPVEGPDPKYVDVCFGGASDDVSTLPEFFPEVSFTFGGGLIYKLDPENYLFQHRKTSGAYCLGFFKNSDPGTLLGGILVRNTLVTYDRTNERVGFLKANCINLFQTMPGGPVTTNVTAFNELAAEAPTGGEDETETTVADNVPATTSPEECKDGCAASIFIRISLSSPYDVFSATATDFTRDLARELSLQQAQVELVGYDSSPTGGVEVRINILPQEDQQYIPSRTAKRIKLLLGEGELGINATFGTYNVEEVAVEEVVVVPSGGTSGGGGGGGLWWLWLLFTFVLLAGLVAGGYFLYKLYRQKTVRPYTTMDDIGGDEDEGAPLGGSNGTEL